MGKCQNPSKKDSDVEDNAYLMAVGVGPAGPGFAGPRELSRITSRTGNVSGDTGNICSYGYINFNFHLVCDKISFNGSERLDLVRIFLFRTNGVL